MFQRIAPRYDLMNRLMTGGRDQAWRRTAARLAAPPPGSLALDLATGTGDLARALLGESRVRGVIGVDFVEGMLRLGRRSSTRSGSGASGSSRGTRSRSRSPTARSAASPRPSCSGTWRTSAPASPRCGG